MYIYRVKKNLKLARAERSFEKYKKTENKYRMFAHIKILQCTINFSPMFLVYFFPLCTVNFLPLCTANFSSLCTVNSPLCAL